jgi:hypothetical protein
MTTDVLKLQGDYQIHAATGGSIVLDVLNNGTTATSGYVVINGNLDVRGTTTYIESVNSNVRDNIITLNSGEPTTAFNGGITAAGGTSGLKISRGRVGNDTDNLAAFIEWNENAVWNGTGRVGQVNGLFEFRIGQTTNNPKFSAIKVNAIRIDQFSASTIGAGTGAPRLNIFGKENPTAVISVAGTSGYADRVVDDDDIPNKKYVDNKLAINGNGATFIATGTTYVKLVDNALTAAPVSEIVGVVHGNLADNPDNITTGTVVMRISDISAQFVGIQLVRNTILPTNLNQDLILSTNSTATQVVFASSAVFAAVNTPRPASGQIGFYSKAPGGGGTGLYYVSSSTTGVVVNDEMVSRKKALVYSLIF